MDKTGQREGDGERGYVGGAAAGASAMAGEGEGERQGRMDVYRGSGRRRGARPGVQGRGQQAGGAVASSCTPASPPCLPGGEEAAGWHGPAQCWAARWAGAWVWLGKMVFHLFLFYFYSCRFVAFLKILRHLQKSPNCTWSLVGIYPAWNIFVWSYLSI